MIFSVTPCPPWHAVAQRMRYTTTVVLNVVLHRVFNSLASSSTRQKSFTPLMKYEHLRLHADIVRPGPYLRNHMSHLSSERILLP